MFYGIYIYFSSRMRVVSVLAVSLSYRAEGSMFSGRSGSSGYTTGSSMSEAIASGMKTVQEWVSGPWRPESIEDQILDFVGYGLAKHDDLTQIMIPKHTQDKHEWGKCHQTDLLYTVMDQTRV